MNASNAQRKPALLVSAVICAILMFMCVALFAQSAREPFSLGPFTGPAWLVTLFAVIGLPAGLVPAWRSRSRCAHVFASTNVLLVLVIVIRSMTYMTQL